AGHELEHLAALGDLLGLVVLASVLEVVPRLLDGLLHEAEFTLDDGVATGGVLRHEEGVVLELDQERRVAGGGLAERHPAALGLADVADRAGDADRLAGKL